MCRCVAGLGFDGELTMSDAMDDLMNSLYLNRVPKSWARLAWPSLRSLQSWLHNWSQRISQLNDWAANPLEVPKVRVCILCVDVYDLSGCVTWEGQVNV